MSANVSNARGGKKAAKAPAKEIPPATQVTFVLAIAFVLVF